MTATVHQISAAQPPAAASGPAPRESPAPFSSATEKCAHAAIAALQGVERAERALYAAEYALDEVNRGAKLIDAARAQLTATILELRSTTLPQLNTMASAFIDRMPK